MANTRMANTRSELDNMTEKEIIAEATSHGYTVLNAQDYSNAKGFRIGENAETGTGYDSWINAANCRLRDIQY